MSSEEVVAECRALGESFQYEIATVREDIDRLARSLNGAFLDLVSKEDLKRLEKAIAYLEKTLQEKKLIPPEHLP